MKATRHRLVSFCPHRGHFAFPGRMTLFCGRWAQPSHYSRVPSSLQDIALGLAIPLTCTFPSPVLLHHTHHYAILEHLPTYHKTAPFSPPPSHGTISPFPLSWDKIKVLAGITVSCGLKFLFEAHRLLAEFSSLCHRTLVSVFHQAIFWRPLQLLEASIVSSLWHP